MQFYLQSSIVEKGVTRRQYKASRIDVVTGCIFTDVVAWFIIVHAPPRSTCMAIMTSAMRQMRRKLCVRWLETMPTSCLP